MRLRILLLFAGAAWAGEWQLTFSPISKALDNNDNFSRDDRFLVYDTRDTLGSGLGNSASIMKVSIATGLESYLYRPPSVQGTQAAPGLAAVSFSPVADEVIFIHGPMLDETPRIGFYGITNRRGAIVKGDGTGEVRFADCRDVASEITPPGAHRGGTHRHEFTEDGSRIGFTYDDHLIASHGRNIGMLVPHNKAPRGASHYFAVLVPIVASAEAKPGDILRAADDSWIGRRGLMRAFTAVVKEADGSTGMALFVVNIPESMDITSADSGSRSRYPTPPKGLTIRRLTRTAAAGIVRGAPDGSKIAFYDKDAKGVRQIFLIRATGPGERPQQVTHLESGATSGLRWHPSGNSIAVISDNGVAAIDVRPGAQFGHTRWLTRHGKDVPAAEGLVWSRDGKMLAFNRRVPTLGASQPVRQIFLVAFE